MLNRKKYGWLPDIPDQRDYLYAAIKPRIRLPVKIDLRRHYFLVERQGNLSTLCQILLENPDFVQYTIYSEQNVNFLFNLMK